MGVFILHEWASRLAVIAAIYSIWAAIWGIFYRKFFWDMIGGVLGPAGLIPGQNAALFVSIIVDFPILQIIVIINGLATLALEWPLSFMKPLRISRSLTFKAVWYLWCALMAILPYQTVDSGVYFALTSAVFVQAIRKGEIPEDSKSNRGKISSA